MTDYGRVRNRHRVVGPKPPAPAARPKCRYCGKHLQPEWTGHQYEHLEDGTIGWIILKQFTGHYGYQGDDLFCSLTCGYKRARRDWIRK